MEPTSQASEASLKQKYNIVGKYGFIYRKDSPEEPKTGIHHEEVTENGAVDSLGHDLTVPMDVSTSEGESANDIEIERSVELELFIEELRKLCSSCEIGENASEIDAKLKLLSEDLKQSGLYNQFLEAPDPDKPHPMAQHLKQNYTEKAIEIYKRELKEWDEVTELKKQAVENAKRTYESEKDVDFARLHCDDVETLKSYLTPEQSKILEQPLLGNPQFMDEARKKLDAINCKLDAELKRIHGRCHQINSKLKLSRNPGGGSLDMSAVDETPRTLFKALKNHA